MGRRDEPSDEIKRQYFMRIRVLGCSGAIAKDCRTTSFLIDQNLLVDAGTGVGDLSLTEMAAVNDVLITHAHLDHIAHLPLMMDAVARLRTQPLRVHGLPETLAALQRYIFNDHIWPDFTQIPSAEHALLSLHPLQPGQPLKIAGKTIEALAAAHTIPAVGYAITAGAGYWVFSGDTGRNPAFWQRINQLNVAILVIETAFSNHEKELAQLSQHLCPEVLAQELDQIDSAQHFPIYISHTKPTQTQRIMDEIQWQTMQAPADRPQRDIRWLQAGQEMSL
jgi:ribonuclease BN (tRNA processing enzyme)